MKLNSLTTFVTVTNSCNGCEFASLYKLLNTYDELRLIFTITLDTFNC